MENIKNDVILEIGHPSHPIGKYYSKVILEIKVLYKF